MFPSRRRPGSQVRRGNHACYLQVYRTAGQHGETKEDSVYGCWYVDREKLSKETRLIRLLDGVAPRAKMNQQRSRRFRSAQDAEEEAAQKAEFQKLLDASGRAAPKKEGGDEEKAHATLDSNVITPGTPFMHLLSESLKFWVAYKISTDPGWAKIKVIISDASVPGEGEHKMMEFIRSQRRSPEHDPNTRHVIYGLDADLIMLGLATHEPHFRILREDVFFQTGKEQKCRICGQKGHYADQCKGEIKEKHGEFDEKEAVIAEKPYIWLHVSVLREYLEIELRVPNQGFKFDLERVIDDYVFLCFFVGNDFLPHLPILSIREEGIDTLVAVWKDNLPIIGGYLTTDGIVDLSKAQCILDGLARQEAAIFKRRRETDVRKENAAKRRKLEKDRRSGNSTPANGTPTQFGRSNSRRKGEENFDNILVFTPTEANSKAVREQAQDIYANRQEIFQAQTTDPNAANKSAAALLKETLKRKQSNSTQVASIENGSETPVDPNTPQSEKRKADVLEDDETGTPGRSTPINTHALGGTAEVSPDNVRLWDEGYEERYYERKFGAAPDDLAFRRKVATAYVEGVSWVLLYYMQGCPSWTWFYPYHYAPFAADFTDMVGMDIKFTKGTPFHPYEQLMGVLPAASNHAIPKPYRTLMEDPDSPIIDFYPVDFPLDMNGEKMKWKAIALLPFIDEKRLLTAMKTRESQLSDDERQRNEFGQDILYFKNTHTMYDDVRTNFYSKKSKGITDFTLNPANTDALSGKVEKIEEFLPLGPISWPFESDAMESLASDQTMRYVLLLFT
jgi:5'-3' exoribonuclease 2